jgi:hypothetical protein
VSGIVDRREWLRQRVRHLETFLEGDISDEQRAAAEAALAEAREQLSHGRNWRRWLLWGARPPT